MPIKKESDIKQIRNLLGLIDSSDIKEKEMSETERKEYCSSIFAIWPRIEKDILLAIKKQMALTFRDADNMDKLALGQGAVNGMTTLYELWQKAATEYESMPKDDKEEFNKNNPIGTI